MILPGYEQPNVSLAFNAPGLSNDTSSGGLVFQGNIVDSAGSIIQAGAQGTVSFNGQTVAILGDVFAPGGSITVKGANAFPTGNPQLTTVDLGPNSILSMAGTTVFIPEIIGNQTYQTGTVLPGGAITVSGNIVGEAGALLDVSGATAVVDLSPYYTSLTGDSVLNTAPQSLQNGTLEGNVPISTRVDSNGGTITLAGAEDLFTDATLLGNAGGPSASGGALIVSDALTSIAVSPAEPSLSVTQNQPTIPVANFYPAGNDAIGYFPVNSKGVALPIMGYFALDSFTSGGFGQLTLAGEVEFQGPINLDASQSLNIGMAALFPRIRVSRCARHLSRWACRLFRPAPRDRPTRFSTATMNSIPALALAA